MIFEYLTLEEKKNKFELYMRLKNLQKVGSDRRVKFRQQAQHYADLYNEEKPIWCRRLKVK